MFPPKVVIALLTVTLPEASRLTLRALPEEPEIVLLTRTLPAACSDRVGVPPVALELRVILAETVISPF